MQTKPELYPVPKPEPEIVAEPVLEYVSRNEASTVSAEIPSSDGWNPNVPFHGTQEEWWEHFHRIEEGNFMTIEEFDIKFEAWKKEYLASKLK